MAGVLLNGNLVIVLLYNILVVTVGRRVEKKDGGDIDKKIMLARCTSRCLTLHITKLSAHFRSLQNDDILTWCGNNRRCAQCMQPCMQLDNMSKQCHRKCENRHECVISCEFLRSLQELRQGQCPPPHRASGFAAACVLSCSADRDCPGKKKCCANGCGFTCQVPVNMFKGVPLKPHSEFTFNEHTNRSVEVVWKSKFNISAEPVLYILQRRWNHGIQPSEDQSTPWQTIAVTAAHRFIMRDVRPGRWYQLQVAAVNVHGTQGFTTPSRHFHSSKDPLPPAAPTDLRSGNLTFARNGTVSVHVTWNALEEQDLKIHHYRISWHSRGDEELYPERKTNSWRITDGVNNEFTLENLLPNTEYLVRVHAVSYWRQKRMKSLPSEILIKTSQQDLKPTVDGCSDITKLYNAICKSSLQAYYFYHNNQVQIKLSWKSMSGNNVEPYTYLIKWRPIVCGNNDTFSEGKAVVKGSNFIITGLQFACKYKVTVRLFTLQRPLVEEVTFVNTPKCNNMNVKNLKHGHCSKRGHHHLSRHVKQTVEKLSATFHSVNGRIEGEFHWQVLQSDQSHVIKGFLFSWADISETVTVYNTQRIPAARTSTLIENLKPSTAYHVRVQIIPKNYDGLFAEKTFFTPRLGL